MSGFVKRFGWFHEKSDKTERRISNIRRSDEEKR